MSARDVDDVEDIASGAEGFLAGAGRAATAFGAGAVFAAADAGGGTGVAGVVGGVTLRDTGRGFGSGTADAAVETRAIAVAPSIAAVQRLSRGDAAGEGASSVTGDLSGESFRSLHLKV
jgi:hypothetical protein